DVALATDHQDRLEQGAELVTAHEADEPQVQVGRALAPEHRGGGQGDTGRSRVLVAGQRLLDHRDVLVRLGYLAQEVEHRPLLPRLVPTRHDELRAAEDDRLDPFGQGRQHLGHLLFESFVQERHAQGYVSQPAGPCQRADPGKLGACRETARYGGTQADMKVPSRAARLATQLRPIRVKNGYMPHAEGSALVEWGATRVVASVTIESKLPPHLRGSAGKTGWLTAEYALLPRSTADRSPRERLYASGRTQEIQRLIGRAMRSTVDLSMFKGKTITVDVDVITADGGTRCAGVVAAYAALHEAADRLVFAGGLDEWPLRYEVGAVSVGVVAGEQRLDL